MGEPAVERRGESSRRRSITTAEKRELLNALRSVRVVADPAARGELLAELNERYGDQLSLSDGPQPVESLAILNQCLRADEMVGLIDVLGLFDADDPEPLIRLAQLRDDLMASPALRAAERSRLLELIERQSREQVREYAQQVVHEQIRDGSHAEILADLEELDDGRQLSPVLEFAERLSHSLTSRAAYSDWHGLIREIAGRAGQTASVDEFCRLFDDDPTAEHPVAGDDPRSESDSTTDGDPGADMQTKIDNATRVVPATLPAIWGGVPPRYPSFSGRRRLLRELRDYLAPGPASVALFGQGGVGKTQIATQFAHEPAGPEDPSQDAGYDLVWWVEADNELSVRRSFDSLARRIGVPQSVDRQNVVDVVLDVLRRDERYKKWLLIYDNADDPDMLRSYLPVGVGHVVITTRNRLWRNQVDAIEVDVFDQEDSVEFLRRRWADLTEPDAVTLATELGHLPLALNQAAAYHEETGIPLESYLSLLESRPTRLLNAGRAAGYPDSVAKTVQAGVDRLGQNSPGALQLFNLCAFLSSQPIAVAMLTRGRFADVPAELAEVIGDDVELRAAVRELGRLGMAQLDAGRDFIKIHTLVRTLIRDGLPADQQQIYTTAAHEVLARANPGDPDRPENWPQLKQIAPHVEPSGVVQAESKGARQVVVDLVRYLYDAGEFGQSKALAELARDTWTSTLGPRDTMTLQVCRHLGNAMRSLGQYREAKDLDDETLRLMEETLGPNHEHTLAVAMGVGADLRLIGNFDGAYAHDKLVFDQNVQVGEGEMTTLRAMNNLAVDHRLLGAYAEAIDLDRRNLAKREEVYGPEHARTLFSKLAVARDLYGLGQYRDGLSLARSTLDEYSKFRTGSIDDKHQAQLNLAILLRKAGHTVEAVRQARQNYADVSERNGTSHERTLLAAMTLVNTLRFVATNPVGRQLAVAAGALSDAFELSEQTLTQYRVKFNANHPFTLACANNHAIVLRAMGQFEAARELDELTNASFEEALGTEHPYTLCCASNMTNNLSYTREVDVDRTRDIYERSAAKRRTNHLNTIGCEFNLALDLEYAGDHQGSKDHRANAIKQIVIELGNDHPETVSLQAGNRYEADIEPPLT